MNRNVYLTFTALFLRNLPRLGVEEKMQLVLRLLCTAAAKALFQRANAPPDSLRLARRPRAVHRERRKGPRTGRDAVRMHRGSPELRDDGQNAERSGYVC